MAVGFPFQGSILYELETSYKNGFDGGTACRFSDVVTDVRIETGDINRELVSISTPSLVDFSKTQEDPMLHVEWTYQPHTGSSMVSYCINRTAGDLSSFAIEVGANTGAGTSAYYRCLGCKCKSFTVSAEQNGNYSISADYSVASLGIYSSATLSDPGAIGTTYAAFNAAGSIEWSGVTGAYVSKAFEFTVDNNITDYWDVGSNAKKCAIPGALSITGSCDISLDDGGETHFDEVIAGTDITHIKLDTGLATGNLGEFVLTGARFDSTSINLNTTSEGIFSSVPFTAKGLHFNAGTP